MDDLNTFARGENNSFLTQPLIDACDLDSGYPQDRSHFFLGKVYALTGGREAAQIDEEKGTGPVPGKDQLLSIIV